MVFVGAPVGDDEWVAEELRFIFGKLVSRLPALVRMRDAGRLQVATAGAHAAAALLCQPARGLLAAHGAAAPRAARGGDLR